MCATHSDISTSACITPRSWNGISPISNTAAAARIVKDLSAFPPNYLENWISLGAGLCAGECCDWWKPQQPLYLQTSFHLAHAPSEHRENRSEEKVCRTGAEMLRRFYF